MAFGIAKKSEVIYNGKHNKKTSVFRGKTH